MYSNCKNRSNEHTQLIIQYEVITRQPAWSPWNGVGYVATLGCRDYKKVTKAIGEPDEGVAIGTRDIRGNRGVVSEDLHGDARERLMSASVTQVNLQRHF